jgi:alginate O-acetyltransferase complex protein AlgI
VNYLSIQFAFFLAAAVLGFYLSPSRHRPLFLLLASYVFYFLWSPAATLGIFGATVFTYFAGKALDPDSDISVDGRRGRRIMILAVTLLVAYLGFFKALGPLKQVLPIDSAHSGGLASLLQQNAMLPLGISYYSFKLIGYLLDVHWRKTPPARNFIEFATYVAFFPQIVAGPIQRSGDFLGQIQNPSSSPEMMKSGLRRLLLGCFKKTVVADNLGVLIALLDPQTPYSAHSSTLLAVYLFPIQLYADFSALTDIAIGVGRLFGIQSPENFDRPFLASNISQFWRRWHMSLTTWLTDYVFLPLRMATRNAGNWGLAFCLLVTMALIGLWHKLNWNLLIFGLLHGVFLTLEALTARRRSRFFKTHPEWDLPVTWAGVAFTFHLVAFSLIFFRAESVSQAFSMIARLAAPAISLGPILASRGALTGLVGLGLLIAFDLLQRPQWVRPWTTPAWGRWAFYYAVIAMIVKYGHNAEGFIYFKF